MFPSKYSFTTFSLNSTLYFDIKKLTSLSWFVSPTFWGQFKSLIIMKGFFNCQIQKNQLNNKLLLIIFHKNEKLVKYFKA